MNPHPPPVPNDEPDPLIDEIRAIRESISAEFGHDVRRLGEHLRALEARHPHLVVNLNPNAAPPPNSEAHRAAS